MLSANLVPHTWAMIGDGVIRRVAPPLPERNMAADAGFRLSNGRLLGCWISFGITLMVQANAGKVYRFGRSGQMSDCLRKALLYSEKRPRDFVFRAIESILAEHRTDELQPLTLSRLARAAAARASGDAREQGIEFENWATTARAVVHAMLGARVLLTHGGQAIAPSVTAHAARVISLKTEYRDDTEAYLLESVIRRLGDVSLSDHVALAHTLFRQFDRSIPVEEMEDRVVVLLARLAGRVELRDDGIYAIRSHSLAQNLR